MAKDCEKMKAGKALDHARMAARSVFSKFSTKGIPYMFKFGVTAGPSHRWENASYGYKHDKWDRMYVVHKTDNTGTALMMEAALIALFDSAPGCQNVAKGGENPPRTSPCYVYFVVRGLSPPGVPGVFA